MGKGEGKDVGDGKGYRGIACLKYEYFVLCTNWDSVSDTTVLQTQNAKFPTSKLHRSGI